MHSRRGSNVAAFIPGLFCLLTASLIYPVAFAAEPTREQLEFFENDIRPLLSKHCFECHGDPDHAEGELLLNSAGGIAHGGASGPVAVAGHPKESLLIKAVEYRGIEMPPNGKLAKSEIDKLTRWVEMGLPWPKGERGESVASPKEKKFEFSDEQRGHWSFQPVTSPVPPEVAAPEWNAHPIDRFLQAARQTQPIQPTALADRATLLRRVTYDLTGLPPTPREISMFVEDESSDAWPKVIDRLLASPHYGERWGRHWLDVIRYADTAGDASDYPLPDAYKFRDYVIESFNRDKPYDQFLKEQYAGDLLAAANPDADFTELTTATSHLALARRFGYNDTNFHYFHLTIHDLLDTMGQSVLGLSVGCARCHDHKFEPISAQDYYALYGIFSSTKFTFPGAEEVRFAKDLIPLAPAAEVEKLKAEQAAVLAQLDREIQQEMLPALNLEGSMESGPGLPIPPWGADMDVKIVATAQSPFRNVFPIGKQVIELPNVSTARGFRRPVPESRPQTTALMYINVDFRNTGVEAGGDGYYRIALDHIPGYSPAAELFINGSQIAVRKQDGLQALASINTGVWYNLQLIVSWQSKTFSITLTDEAQSLPLGEFPFNPAWDGVVNSLVVDTHGTDPELIRPLRQLDNLAVQLTPFPAARTVQTRTTEELQTELAGIRQKLAALKSQRDEAGARLPYPTVYGVTEGTPANAKMQMRGEPDRLGEEVPRGFLTILGGQKLDPSSHESGRRELADWLTSSSNPLMARVMVNRIWQGHFGRGIVATPNDFGIRGERPSHPELLDYLASQFREEGYSIKEMHRLILSSRTYQLAGSENSADLAQDPENIWLCRHQRQRLDAEELRDTWLLVAGELDLSMGGEAHPFPPMSKWAFSQHNPFDAVYPSSKRTVYLMTQRIKRHPFLALFDGADPNATTARRERTTTPAQALFMMNDEFMHSRSKAVAGRLLNDDSDEAEQITALYRQTLARSPTAEEQQLAQTFRQAYTAQLQEKQEAELQSLAAFVRVVLSSNEFLYLN